MIKCLIVDDESLARELVINYLSHFDNFKVVSECKTAIEAMQFMSKNEVDLLFLDINMPQISGIELLQQMPQKPMTILCTAYSEYALEGFDLEVVDYLLKPISFARFTKAIGKVLRMQGTNVVAVPTEKESKSFFVKSDYKKIKIDPAKIKYIEAMEKYVMIHLQEEKIMTLMSMSSMMNLLDDQQFFRVHRSFIVNSKAITAIEGNMLILDEDQIPISKANRKLVEKIINA